MVGGPGLEEMSEITRVVVSLDMTMID